MVHVTDPLPRACCPSQLEHPLAVPAEQSLVEVKDDPGLFVFERVFDQGRQATCPSVTFGAAPPGIVDDDAHPEIADPDDRVCDLALPRIALVLHVKAALARENQIAQLLPRSLQMVAVHAGGDDEVIPCLAFVDVHVHGFVRSPPGDGMRLKPHEPHHTANLYAFDAYD
jgi:hypothetical protein